MPIEAEPQRTGDPARGYRALLNEAYVPCGIPLSTFQAATQPPKASDALTGREGKNAGLPYAFTAMTTKAGIELATSNCLTCHAGHIMGSLVVGLGAADGDFTSDQSVSAGAASVLISDPGERAEYDKWLARVKAIAPYSILDTVGVNPADTFTGVLFAHHDPKTMEWSTAPLWPLPAPSAIPVDVPPWWRMKKKTAMFYGGAGRGDHARIMMTASVLCSSSVDESRAIDAFFPDIRAYLTSIVPPKYPFAIDSERAAAGQSVFESTCARCHGTYGESPTYANRLIPLATIGTDPLLSSGDTEFTRDYASWYAASFFGEMARFESGDGYVAPPLDGIWATAPYLHNGSVPTLEALLDSSKRPTYWTRSFDSSDYDEVRVGFRTTTLDHGKVAGSSGSANRRIYDTTRPGYGNAGHTFGDGLSDADRGAVIEYLKTL